MAKTCGGIFRVLCRRTWFREGKLRAKGGIAGNERGMIIWGVRSIIYMEIQKNEGKAPAPPF